MKSLLLIVLFFCSFLNSSAHYSSVYSLSYDLRLMGLKNGSKTIEGTYQAMTNNADLKHRISIVKNANNGYSILFLSGARSFSNWKEGEEMGFISPESTQQNEYYYANFNWLLPNKVLNQTANLSPKGENRLVLSFSNRKDILIEYAKEIDFLPTPVSPPSEATEMMDSRRQNRGREEHQEIYMSHNIAGTALEKKTLISSGSSIAISKDGYIVTNKHVIEGASQFEVKQYKDKDSITYTAILIYKDPVHDIAILRIYDNDFEGLGNIPYALSTNTAELGQEVFTLGYPLCEQLGKEVKLGKGLINSKAGFKDNKSAYTTDIELLAGNSGGGLFNILGELEGIIFARFSESDNMGYAIKSQVLVDILRTNQIPVLIPTTNEIEGLPLIEQIKKLKPFAFRVVAYK